MNDEFNLKEWTYDLICILERRGIEYYIQYCIGDTLWFSIDNTGVEMTISDTFEAIQIHNKWYGYGEDEFMYLKNLKELDEWLETQKWGHKH